MDTLPYVVLRETAQYLSDQDLAAWSATSRNLREVLNDNQLWRPRCDPLLAEYLRNTECQVEPYFQSPEIEGSGLSPICEWRLCFMRQVHLWNNWRNDRHFEQDMSGKISPDIRCLQFYQNEFLLGVNEKDVELWNVRRSPVLLCRKPLLSRKRLLNFSEAYGDKFVAMQHDLVQVFQISISTGEIIFLHCFYSEGKEKNPSQIYNPTTGLIDLSEIEKGEDHDIWYRISVSATLIRGIIVAWCGNSPQILHAWNAEKGTKVREIEIGQMTDVEISRRSDSDKSYMTFSAEDEEDQVSVQVYCLKDFVPIFKSQTYTDFPSDMLVVQDYVVIALIERFVDIYELKTAQRILKVDTKNYLSQIRLYSVESNVFFSTNLGTLMKFSACNANLETIFIENGQPLESPSRPMCFLNQRYLITNTNWSDGIFHLNEVKEGKVIQRHKLSIKPGTYAYVRNQIVNQSCTKLIVKDSYAGTGDRGRRMVTIW